MNTRPFYKMKSINKLKELLYINNFNFINKYQMYLTKDNRLVENPNPKLKMVQRRILQLLQRENNLIPNYIMNRKGSSWIENGTFHKESKYFYIIDLSKFFPSIVRIKVFYYFRHYQKTSIDVANTLANILTINIDDIKMKSSVKEWYDEVNTTRKHCIPLSHLPTGSPTSPILSYLTNIAMFNELNTISKNINLKMSIYVDDITFSSSSPISKSTRDKINNVINKNRYTINKNKTKLKTRKYDHIVITGVVLQKSSNGVTIKNKLSKKIVDYLIKIGYEEYIPHQLTQLLNTVKMISPKDHKRFSKMVKKTNKSL